MFFAYVVLRPSAAALDAPARLELWAKVFQRFFPWVWASVIALLATGFGMVIWGFGGFGAVPPFVHAMLGLGLLMTAIFLYLYFGLWQVYARAVAAKDWKLAGAKLGSIRRVVGVNLTLGIATVLIGAGGRFWG
jgi:uncharacterized membrane protein